MAAAAGLAALFISTGAMAGKDLDAVKARGALICGVGQGMAGFMLADSQGKWTGLDVDVCRAVAAAIFGDAEKVKYVPLSSQQRFTALQSGEVDMLSNNTTSRSRATPRSASISPASPTTTARASWCPRSSA